MRCYAFTSRREFRNIFSQPFKRACAWHPRFTAGAGIEAAFADNRTTRVEYLFADLHNATFNPPVTPVTVKFSNTNLLRVGVDYKYR